MPSLRRLAPPALCLALLPSTAPAQTDTCGGTGLQGLVGQVRAIAEMLELDQPLRIYGVNDAITMDFVAERINFVIGEDGRIAQVRCG